MHLHTKSEVGLIDYSNLNKYKMQKDKETLLQVRLSYITDTEKMTQYKFARGVLGISQTQYCEYEKMKREPFDTTKQHIANRLGRTIDSIIWKL